MYFSHFAVFLSKQTSDDLGGGFNHFLFSPRTLGKWSNLTCADFSDGWRKPPTSDSFVIACHNQNAHVALNLCSSELNNPLTLHCCLAPQKNVMSSLGGDGWWGNTRIKRVVWVVPTSNPPQKNNLWNEPRKKKITAVGHIRDEILSIVYLVILIKA